MPPLHPSPDNSFGAPHASHDNRLAVQEALHEREDLFRHMFDQSPIGAAVISLDGRFLLVNEALRGITGYTEDELLARSFTDILHPADVGAGVAQVNQLVCSAIDRYSVDTRSIGRDEQIVWVHLSLRQLRNAEGVPIALILLMDDITARKRAEAVLHENETRFERVLQAAPVMVFTHDCDLRYTWVHNPVWPRPTKVVSRTDADLLVPTEAWALLLLKRQVLNTGIGVRREIPLTVGGREFVFDMKLEPFIDDQGTVAGLIGMAIDVTERVRAQKRHLAIERRLQETQRREGIGVLAGGIAHDFNNLLAIVLANADLTLEDLPADSPLRLSLQQIIAAARHAAEITRQLLIYAGQAHFNVQSLDVNDIVHNNAMLLAASVGPSVRLVYNLAAAIPEVLGDETQVGQILLNLVLNAAEALGAAGTVTITTIARDLTVDDLARYQVGHNCLPGRYVALIVSDTGTGIEARLLPHIFEPFATTKFAGRGLGLAVVQGIVQRHNGALHVASIRGQGSCFTVLLPAVLESSSVLSMPGSPCWLAQRCAGDRW